MGSAPRPVASPPPLRGQPTFPALVAAQGDATVESSCEQPKDQRIGPWAAPAKEEWQDAVSPLTVLIADVKKLKRNIQFPDETPVKQECQEAISPVTGSLADI